MPSTRHCPRSWRAGLAACLLAMMVAGCASVPAGHSPHHARDRNALWRIVHDRCVPAARQGRMVPPCVEVVLANDAREGYVVMKDMRGVAQYLVLPTARISGIESPRLLAPDAPDYLADAWKARRWVNASLKRRLPRGDIALAINSMQGRSQDQLHIHVDCIRGDVRAALDRMLPRIGDGWSRLPQPLAGRRYRAMRLLGRRLPANPLRLLARSLPPGQSMGHQTLVVVGQRFADGRAGFLLLAHQSHLAMGDPGSGEALLDHQCRIGDAAAAH